MDSDKRVLIGMSGGIDSSAACMILQEQGYEVIGLTMRMWDLPRHFPNEGQSIPQFARGQRTGREDRNRTPHSRCKRRFQENGHKKFYRRIFKREYSQPMCSLQ